MTETLFTDRTQINRIAERQQTDPAVMHAILDEALVAHVGFIRGTTPVVIPFAFARDGDSVLIHGSSGGGVFLSEAGTEVSVCITLIDGLVFERSVFDSDMNYRSAVIFGRAMPVPSEEKVAALRVISEHLMPGRWDELRPTTKKELAATVVLRISLDEYSVKVNDDQATDNNDDDLTVWAGVLPLRIRAGEPVPSVLTEAEVPASVRNALLRF